MLGQRNNSKIYTVISILAISCSALLFFQRGVAQTTTPITSCQTISSSGAYVIADSFPYDAASQPEAGVCIIIAANDVTLNGNGKTITAVGTAANGQFAVDVRDLGGSHAWNNILVENLNSNAAVRSFGPTINHVTFDHLKVNGVTVIGSDDVTITNNTIADGGISVNQNDTVDEPWAPYRPVIRDNTITGSNAALFEISGGAVALSVCPNLSAVVDHNTITNTVVSASTAPDVWTVRIRCATHSTVTNNTIRATDTALGLYLRDESDDGVYTDNFFITHSRKAIHIGSGNDNKTHPARNVFRNNTFRSDDSYVAYLLGMGGGNQFIDNVFYAHSNEVTPNGDTIVGYIGSDFGDTFDHNTFYADGTGAAVLSLTDSGQAGPPMVNFTNNVFSYNSAQAVWQFDSFPKSRYAGDYNLFYNRNNDTISFGNYGATLAAWRATSPASDTHSISGDPLFTNVSIGDYSLPDNSIGHFAASDGTDMGARGATSIPACTESWTCTTWSTCANGQQTRTCVDANSCSTTSDRPVLTQSCTELPADTIPPAAVNDLTTN